MKSKLFCLTLVATLLFSNISFAKIRRVGYSGTPVVGTDYTDLQSAHDSASVRDTIMLYTGSWSCNVSKKLIFIGPGYYVTGAGANAGLQNITGAVSGSFVLYAGSDSSVYEGIDGLSLYPYYDETVNNVIIRRCHGNFYQNNKTLNNWQITQSYIYISPNWSGGKLTNFTVSNCYFAYIFLETNTSQSGQFNNNIIEQCNFGNGGFLLKNNIFISSHSNDVNCVFQNCIGQEQYPLVTGNNNKTIPYANMLDSVFVGYGTQGAFSNDGRYALKSTSPAKGAGVGGTDCGIFGGTNPYKLSGIPKIPAFYKLTAPSNTTSTNPFTITFSVRSNN